jgi:L-lactate dehydrogenase (cytochrome)
VKLNEVRDLIRLQPIDTDPVRRRLARCLSVDDVRSAAARMLPRSVFDYVDGAADEEITAAANRQAFQRWRFSPQALHDVTRADLTVETLDRRFATPLVLAPTGYTRMMHPDGELAVARAARPRQVPYGLSTVGTTTIEDLAATGHQDLWFQLYALKDHDLTRRLVERAVSAGYRVLEITVDTAVAGRRLRDVRNGLTIPPALTARTVADIGRHLHYWVGMVTSPALGFANLGEPSVGEDRVTAANMASLFNPALSWDDIAQLRQWWPGSLLLKGPVGPADARRAVDLGVDGFHLSNHGGRQLDRTAPSVDLIRPVRQEVGPEVAIVVDSGIRHGSDMAVAIARGADLCAVGRPYLYGLAAGGERGVAHVIELLLGQLSRTLQLLGVASVAELRAGGDEFVRRADASDSPWRVGLAD